MSLSREFNTLSGKIVSIAEFRAKLAEHGIDPDYDKHNPPSQAALARKVKELEAAGESLDALVPSTYITEAVVSSIEERVLREDDEDVAYALIADEMKSQMPGEYYCDVFPTARAIALFYDDEKLVDGFIRAAKECTDYRSQLDAGTLRETMAAFEGVASKVEAKFSR